MTQLALLNLSDDDVDLLTRLSRRDDLRLEALYQSDPTALAARLAGIADIPVFTDIEALADLSIELCAGREETRALALRLAGRARAAGRRGPSFVLIDDLLRRLGVPEDALEPAGAEPAASDLLPPLEAPEPSFGVPTIDLFYDPARLSAWLADASWKFAGADSAVVWRREAEGRRWTLMSFAPSADRLPPVAFPPEELEQRLTEGRLESRPVGDAAAPFRALFVPLPGEASPFGLLGVFKSWTPGEWPRPVRETLAARGVELGQALDRCVNVSRIGLELKHLRFKERVRDLLLEGSDTPAVRWGRCLAALLEEVPARGAWYFERTPDGQRLELIAATSSGGAVHGQLSIPVGFGLVGGAFGRSRKVSWFAEDPDVGGETCAIPIDAGRGAARTPLGVLLLEGVPSSDQDEGAAARRIDLIRDILAPILAAPEPAE